MYFCCVVVFGAFQFAFFCVSNVCYELERGVFFLQSSQLCLLVVVDVSVVNVQLRQGFVGGSWRSIEFALVFLFALVELLCFFVCGQRALRFHSSCVDTCYMLLS